MSFLQVTKCYSYGFLQLLKSKNILRECMGPPVYNLHSEHTECSVIIRTLEAMEDLQESKTSQSEVVNCKQPEPRMRLYLKK